MKGDAWEGGHRVPFIAKWPNRIKAGRKSNRLICHTDLLATIADLLEKPLSDNVAEDSVSFFPELISENPVTNTPGTLIHQSSAGVLSVRDGPWKLIPQLGSGGFTKPRRIKPQPAGPEGQLYHLRDDLAETTNVYKRHPEIVRRLSRAMETLRQHGRRQP